VQDDLAGTAEAGKLIPLRLASRVDGVGPAESSARQSLPRPLTSFVGRERELAELEHLLKACRLLTLIGPGGCGKTRLALELAHRLASRYPDGTAVVSLAPLAAPSLVLPTIAEVVGLHRLPGEPPLETLVRGIGARRMLLLLDNFEHLLGASSVLPELLATCGRLTVVVTSREVLRVQGEQLFPVPPLALPNGAEAVVAGGDAVSSVSRSEAGRLFLDRARGVQPGFRLDPATAAAVASICGRLDGLPLAIELAAARVRLLNPQTIASRLEHRLPFLTGGARDLPLRQQTLRDTIAGSHNLLAEEERRLFRRLSVFTGGWTLDAADGVTRWVSGAGEAVPSSPAPRSQALDTLDLLGSLVDKSLIVQQVGPGDEPRFTMLETIREFALERLAESDEEIEARRHHLAWFASFAERFQPGTLGPDGPIWLERVAADFDNCRAALGWSLQDADDNSAYAGLRLAGGLQQFWLFREHLAEGAHWFEQLLAADDARGGRERPRRDGTVPALRTGAHGIYPRVIALNGRGILIAAMGRRQEAVAHEYETLAYARSVDDLPGEAHALIGLAQYLPTTELERIIEIAEEGIAIARRLGEPFATWRGLRALGAALRVQGDYELARLAVEESLSVARTGGYLWQIGTSIHELGIIADIQGDPERAIALIEESLACYQSMGATRGLHDSLNTLGHLSLGRGQLDRARACFAESLTLSYRAGDRPAVARSLEGLAVTLLAGSPAGSSSSAVQAAQLLAAADVYTDTGHSGSPARKPHIRTETAIAEIRSSLGDHVFAAAWAEGQALSPEAAYAFGLAVAPPAGPPTVTTRLGHPEGGALTPREREIAALVATGRTNRQIAAALVISGRTVETHVHNILAKLDLSTRAQLAVWAIEHGLDSTEHR
jgi:non-specific serine/threonine protein kinase